MDVDDCVLSAGRAVLELVEQEWQPLSPGELEQRLDQAVEEQLEAELMAQLRGQPGLTRAPTGFVQLLENRADASPRLPQPSREEEEEVQEPRGLTLQPPVDGEALKVKSA